MIWWIEQIGWFLCTASDGYPLKLSKFAILGWAGIFWHRLSTNQIVRCFKLKNLKSYLRCHVDFLLPLKLQKISCYFGLCRKILLANQFAGFFTFDLFDMLILIPRLHCYIVLVVIVVVVIIIIIVLYLTSVKILCKW